MDFNFNVTGNGLSSETNCTFYENGSSIGTLTGLSPDTNYQFTVNHTKELEANYTYYIECGSDTGLYDNSSTKTLEWSLVTPLNNYIGSNFAGLIDNYNIFDEALTPEELYTLFLGEQLPLTKTNLSTRSLSWPELSFDVNVSLFGLWNEGATCTLIDNVTWVSCLPASQSLSTTNSTTFTCTATEQNTGDVDVYAQCDGIVNKLVNSSVFTYSITADSNPVINTNFSSTYDLFTLEALSLNITGYNWTEQPTSCLFTYNDTGFTCLDIGLIDDSNYQYSNTTTCTPDYVQEKDYNVTVTCAGATYSNIITSNLVTIDADSNPDQYSNISATLSTPTLEQFDILIYEENWFEDATCALVFNDTGVTCNSTLINEGSNGVIGCNADYVQTKDYSVDVNCNGTLYPNINSTTSATFTLDADSNPSLAGNFTNLGLSIGEDFDILVTGTNYYESTTNCNFIWNVSEDNAECPAFNMTANQTNPSYTTVTCTELHEESRSHDVYIQCNGTLYNNINSPTYTVYHDSLIPSIIQLAPALDNSSWKLDTDDFTFDITTSHPGLSNITLVNVSCYNESNNLVWGNSTSYNVDSVNYAAKITNMTYANRFRCEVLVSDTYGQTNQTSSNITVVSQSTNISSYTKETYPFDIEIDFDFNGDAVTCGGVDSENALSCTSVSGSLPLVTTCTPLDDFEVNTSLYIQCNSTDNPSLNNINSTAGYIFIDTILPVITVIYPKPDGSTRTLNNTAFTYNISVEDNNTYAFSINCSTGGAPNVAGTEVYSFKEEDINQRVYNFINTTTIAETGLIQCLVNVSDDHTDNQFTTTTKVDKVDKDEAKGKIGMMDFTIKEVKHKEKDKGKDKKTDIKEVKIKYKKGAYSLDIKFDNPNKKTILVPVTLSCPTTPYKRNTNSKYKEHWVCLTGNGIEGYWIDGNTLDDKDIVSSELNSITNEITYFYETTNEEIVMESIGGLNYNYTYFNFTSDFYESIEFAAYNFWNSSTINLFNVTITNTTTTTLYSTTNGSLLLNLANGTYTVKQTAPSYAFGNLSTTYTSGAGVTYNTPFWQAELTVNAKESVSRSLIPGATINVTTTNGLSITSDVTYSSTTGSEFYKLNIGSFNASINVSNHYFNNYADSVLSSLYLGEQRTIDLNFTRRYNVTIRREETNKPFNFTESNTSQVEVKITIICDTKEMEYIINSTQSWIEGIDCDFTASEGEKGWLVRVRYPEAEAAGGLGSYYRYIIPDKTETDVIIWLIELQTQSDVAVENKVSLTDLSNEFGKAIISVETYFNDSKTWEEVIAQKIDVTQEVQLWLDEGQSYNLYVTNDAGVKTFKDYFIAESEVTSVVTPNIAIFDEDPNPQDETSIVYLADKDAGTLLMTYTDTTTLGFDNLTWNVYKLNTSTISNLSFIISDNKIVKSLVCNKIWIDGANVSHTCSGLESTQTYFTETKLNHKNTGDYEETSARIIWYGHATTFPGFEDWDDDIKLWFGMVIVLVLLLSFSIASIELGMAVSLLVATFFTYLDWFKPLGNLRITTWLIFFTIATGFMWYRKAQKTE